jgi:hypothetical protein
MKKVNKNTFKKILKENEYTVTGNVREDEACYQYDYTGEKAKEEMLSLLKCSFVTQEEDCYCVMTSFSSFNVYVK